jgi:RHS repeat-associated protein
LVREQTDGTWVAFDGQGRTYRFAATAPALAAAGLFLLQDINGPGGSNVHLDYAIATPTLSAVPALSIDLGSVSYNPSPTTAGCYKNAVSLTYDANTTNPLSLSVVGGKVLVRHHKLTVVDVLAKETCGASNVRLRRYQLSYAADADTQLPRLQSVQLFGRAGTPEASTPIPVATYTYATASSGGKLTYQSVSMSGLEQDLGHSTPDDSPLPAFQFGTGYASSQILTDITGDGRPDLVTFSRDGNKLTVSRNTQVGDMIKFETPRALDTNVLDPVPLETRSTLSNSDMVWRQAIDMNGDGRIDVVDAAEQLGHWVLYLNTPDPTNPTKVLWKRRTYAIGALAQVLQSRGISVDANHVPLSRRATLKKSVTKITCWLFNGFEWVEDEEALLRGACHGFTGPYLETTITEWEVKDINSDGYPDVVFNSSRPVILSEVVDERPEDPPPWFVGFRTVTEFAVLGLRASNKIEAVLNVLGMRTTEGHDASFSAPVTLRNNDACGVAKWQEDEAAMQSLTCDIIDVNGDGLVDRVSGTGVHLGTAGTTSGGFFTISPMLRLPSPLAVQNNDRVAACAPGSGRFGFRVSQLAGLRDLTGDGIPDYAWKNVAGPWSVAIGTGAGFTVGVPVEGVSFELSSQTEDCAGAQSTTDRGLFDIDGDGKADVLTGGRVYELVGSSGTPGSVDAGRLIQVDNGFGAQTTIRYRSAKRDSITLHQLPFPEIVVDSVETTGTKGFGGTLSATRYAYGGAELMFDPAVDSFRFPGYRRRVVLQTPVNQPAGMATVSITDMYAPASAANPLGLTTTSTITAEQRYALLARIGRVRDMTVLSGSVGDAAIADPSTLLGINVNTDNRRIGATHYEYDARLLLSSGPEPCSEMVFPYDVSGSTTFADTHDPYDACMARGFGFQLSAQSWRGEPGAAPPATANVETRTEVRSIDDLGRVLTLAQLNDLHRIDDDICVVTRYAVPTGTNERHLHAPSSREMTNCGSGGSGSAKTFVGGRWEYDHLPEGSVSSGFPTAYIVERRDDTGALINTIRQFDANFDALGNATSVTTVREDSASRTVTTTYDPFGLVPINVVTTATGVPALQTTITPHPLTMNVLSVTGPNGAQNGATFDGFDRVVLSTVTPTGGVAGAMSITTYFGFSGSDSAGRRIEQKVFTDAVVPSTASAAPGRTGTVFLDELGRERRTELALGASYSNQKLIVGHRTYDGLGRIVFAADPYPSTQSFATAYGTSAFFKADGTARCTVRANGPFPMASVPVNESQPIVADESQEAYPTCIQRVFQDHTEVLSVLDAASLLRGSLQDGVTKTSYTTAIGRVLARSTWQGASRLEHATFAYDLLGRRTGMTRYQDAGTGTKPVTSSWHYDSLGQLLRLDEPDSVPQLNTYSNWGELLAVTRHPSWPSTSQVRRVVKTYDALGRVMHSEEQSNGVADPETVNDYFYDLAANVAPQVTPTFVLGRLALATSPTGSASFSYDGLGRINARVFTDNHSSVYIEKHKLHADGTPETLELLLPDAAYAAERVTYQYDSAGRGTTVKYGSGVNPDTLYDASTIDPFGRVRQAKYGQADYAASYADVGRRLLNQVIVSSPSGSRAFTYQGFDPVGRERSRVEVKNGASTGATTAWSYDALGRLSSALTTSGATTMLSQQFTYDPLGNVLAMTNSGGAETTNTALSYLDTDRDRICRIKYGNDTGTACNVTYDEVGSILTQATPTGQRQYSYLIDGSVRTIGDSQGSVAHFRYDAFGAVQELDLTSPVSPDTRTDRHYGNLLTVRLEHGTPVLLRKVPGPDGFLATRHGAGGPWTFTFGEPRGNRFFTDQSGVFVQDAAYQPFGKTTSSGAQPGSTLYNSEQWNQGDLLGAFGISQLGARLYDPAIGRFLSRDPLLVPMTAATGNPYAFASNDPVNSSDPSGLFPADVLGIIKCIWGDCDSGSNDDDTGTPPPPTIWESPIAGALYTDPDLRDFIGASPAVPAAPSTVTTRTLHSRLAAATGWMSGIAGDAFEYVREPLADVVQMGGTIAGGVIGAGGGTILGAGPWGAPAGAAIGAGLGAGIAYPVAEWIRGGTPTLGGQLAAAGFGALSEGVGQAVGPYIAGLIMKTIGRACFVAGTLVKTGRGMLPIEQVQIGDLVWSREAVSGKEDWKPVLRTFVTINKDVVTMTLIEADGDQQELHVTPEHPLWTVRGWAPAGDLHLGERVWARDGWAKLVSFVRENYKQTVYNLEIADYHTYFVSAGGIWVHNSCVDIARAIARKIPAEFKCIGQCDAFASRMQDRLVERGVAGERIRINMGPRTNPYSNKYGSLGGTGSFHEAIRVGDTVFDNVRPGGVPLAEFVDDMGGFSFLRSQGATIESAPF